MEHHRSRLRLIRFAQMAIELQDVGDALRDLVAGAVSSRRRGVWARAWGDGVDSMGCALGDATGASIAGFGGKGEVSRNLSKAIERSRLCGYLDAKPYWLSERLIQRGDVRVSKLNA